MSASSGVAAGGFSGRRQRISSVCAACALSEKTAMTDVYRLSRQKKRYHHPLLEEAVSQVAEKEKADFPALVHRQRRH